MTILQKLPVSGTDFRLETVELSLGSFGTEEFIPASNDTGCVLAVFPRRPHLGRHPGLAESSAFSRFPLHAIQHDCQSLKTLSAER